MDRRFSLMAAVVAGMVIMALLVQAYHISGKPVVCTTCHSMGDAASAWRMSNHGHFSCVECHLPAAGTVTKLIYKTQAGLHDLWHEMMRNYPASLTLSTRSNAIVNGNCMRCHQSTVGRVTMLTEEPLSCTKCHRRTVHGTSKKVEE